MFKIIILSFVYLVSAKAFAWGSTGHRVVGEIAEKYLTTSTKKKITNILKGDSLAKVATWPDEIKSEPETYSHTYVANYIT